MIEPGAPVGDSYRELVARLAELPPVLAREQAQITSWYERQIDDARAAVARATRGAARAEADLASARSAVRWTDAEVLRLWRLLERRTGPVGAPPEPAPAAPAEDPFPLLYAVAERLEKAVQPPPAMSAGVWSLLALIGAGGAGLGYAAAWVLHQVVLAIAGGIGLWTLAVEQVLVVAAVLLGMLPARALVARQGAPFTIAVVVAVLGPGVLTGGALIYLAGL